MERSTTCACTMHNRADARAASRNPVDPHHTKDDGDEGQRISKVESKQAAPERVLGMGAARSKIMAGSKDDGSCNNNIISIQFNGSCPISNDAQPAKDTTTKDDELYRLWPFVGWFCLVGFQCPMSGLPKQGYYAKTSCTPTKRHACGWK